MGQFSSLIKPSHTQVTLATVAQNPPGMRYTRSSLEPIRETTPALLSHPAYYDLCTRAVTKFRGRCQRRLTPKSRIRSSTLTITSSTRVKMMTNTLLLSCCQEYFSGYIWLEPTAYEDSEYDSDILASWTRVFTASDIWVSDQGSHYKNKVLQNLSTTHRIGHNLTIAYSPWVNSTV